MPADIGSHVVVDVKQPGNRDTVLIGDQQVDGDQGIVAALLTTCPNLGYNAHGLL